MGLELAPAVLRCLRCERIVGGNLQRELCPACASAAEEAEHAWFYELLSDQDPPTLEELVGPRPAWMRQLHAGGMGPRRFFPEKGETAAPAKAICSWCEVRQECLACIMAAEPCTPGVWAGTSEWDRAT